MMSRAMLLLALCAGCQPAAGPRVSPQEVQAGFAARVETKDPLALAWKRAAEHTARMLIQDVTEPRTDRAGAETLRVRALHDGRAITFRLEWDDASEDRSLGPARFSDAVAVQLPAVVGGNVPSAFMGERGRPVRIHMWRAAWQEPALAAPERVVKALYPNATSDHYPPGAARSKAAREALERQYAPALAAGNPVSPQRRPRREDPDSSAPRGAPAPTQDLEAEGFGTLTALARQRSSGRGEWRAKVWRVLLTLPLEGGSLAAGKRGYVAFALWDGAARHVGGRKMRSNWNSLTLEAAR